jgi:PAS domain S-box-containing protein
MAVALQKLREEVEDRKRAEKALSASEEKYRLLFENANDAIFIAQDGVIKFPNPQVLKMTRYTKEELAKIPFINLIHPEDRDLVLERHKRRLTGEEFPMTYSFRVVNKFGQELWVQINAAAITWEDRPATINFLRDITEQMHLEQQIQQSQKMESIGTLAGGIAHDFNNILTLIIGYTQMTQLEFPKESQNWQDLQEVLLAAYRATDLARQILSFSRQTEKAIQPVRVQDIIRESLKLLRPSIPSTITILESIDQQCQPVMADPTQMHQILMNLCTNAYYAMRNSGGTLAITLSEIAVNPGDIVGNINVRKGEYLHLEVSDTGTGIMPEVLDRIFEPYYTTKPKGEGTGLGLAVVHGIVTGHRGDITVYSEIGKGTTFNVYLPVTAADQIPDEMLLQKATAGGSERIMLVDDDSVIIKLEKKHLESLGYQVTALTSGVEAIEVFNAAPEAVDLVITDMTMPKMTGAELAQTLLKIRPDLPIILCTGYSSLIDRESALALGIRQYLMKPLSVNDLARTVRQILDQQPVDNAG